ncbi:polysaccharide deacetylase family protein [Luteimonas deserti]|nr:polysaccharide deacetylase family protein [Luteimonas deserti]
MQMRTRARAGLFATLLCAALPGVTRADDAPPYPWPGGARAAVSLAYDDALPSHLDTAIPALDRYGLHGSFYLVLAADTVRTRLEAWRAAARRGHELGNHSLFHPCSAAGEDRGWVEPGQDLDTMSVARVQAEVALGNTLLHAIDGSTEHTFTAPCGDRRAADGDYVTGLESRFLGIKLGTGAVVPDMRRLDRMAVPVAVPVGSTGAELIALVEAAGRRGTMVNFTFHGIGGDHLAVSREAHDALLAYLAAHRATYWTATFREQMRWVRDLEPAGD